MPEQGSDTLDWVLEESAQGSATEKCLTLFTVSEVIGINLVDFNASQIASHSQCSVEYSVRSSANI